MAALRVTRASRYLSLATISKPTTAAHHCHGYFNPSGGNKRSTPRYLNREPESLSKVLYSTDSEVKEQQDKPNNRELTLGERILRGIGWAGGFYSKKQVQLRSAANIYTECVGQSMYKELYDLCGLPDTFQSWFLVTQLHVWMCLVRLKQDGRKHSVLYRQLVALFWQDVEHRIKLTGLDDRTLIRESTRELLSIFHGLLFAYDEGISSDDQVLAAALWRNLFHDKKSETSVQHLALLVGYVRREMKRLDDIPTELLVNRGQITFSKPPKPISMNIMGDDNPKTDANEAITSPH